MNYSAFILSSERMEEKQLQQNKDFARYQNYAPFELLPEQNEEKQLQQIKQGLRNQVYIDSYVNQNNLIKLKSDYYNCTIYYNDPNKNIIVCVKTLGPPKFIVPPHTEYQHIKELNNL
jgi:hypothetical protein